MDDKELRLDSGLGTNIHDDCTKRTQNGNMPHTNREKSFSDSPHTLGKADTRPCAIIGPDRVLPPTESSDVYMKTIPVDPWEYSDNYRYPYDSIKMADYHQTRNISPRQTFQENMQRIMVPPTYSSIKISEEANLKNVKLNMPSEGKYCDVPYSINTINSEHKNVRSDSVMPTINPSYPRGVPSHGWHAGPGMQPLKPYQTPDYYQNSEYANCTGLRPMPVQPQRIVHEELLPVYQDRLYQDSNIRFKPYPTGKERFPQTRYEYVSSNTFQPPSQIPQHKYDIQKPMHNHHYSMYPQGPYKYVDRRYPEPLVEGYPRVPHPQHNTFRGQPIHPPSYGPLPGNFYQKPYPCPSETSKPMHLNKIAYDPNNKIYLELDNSRSKGYPLPDNHFYNERVKFMRGEVLVPGHSHASMNSMHQHHLYRKDNSPNKMYDHGPHYHHRDHNINVTNPITRLPMQFSPNTIAISPCDSITSSETQMLGMSQEDCGYASQSSTTSVKSMDSMDYYKRQVYNYASTQNNSQRVNISSKPSNTSDKKGLNVRQFLQMWNEGDEEESENNKEIQNNLNQTVLSRSQSNNNQEQLYVLGLVNVSSEDLSKYEHLQKVSKLPENIKGYNNIEILNQFEQLVESPNMNNFHVKKPPLKEYKVVPQSFTNKQTKEDLLRPLSPLDVEAKISQSVIHKEVGCNFEIKPCSPKVLNVDMATPVHDILGERLIEKVANPVLLNIGRGKETKTDKSVDMDSKSCKMINSSYSPNNLPTVKPIYPLQDLDTNMGVCLASLPQLDNEIELNLPEVNQQFIDANKIGVSPLTRSNLPALEINEQDHNTTNNMNTFQSNCDGQGGAHIEPDKEILKLSKYRKTKKLESAIIDNNMPTLTQRTDSVIIKNPENVKIQNECYNSYEIEDSTVNRNIHSEVINKSDISNNLQSCENVETAIDFSFTRNESISLGQISANNDCNISTAFLLQGSDFCKNNIDLSLPSLPTGNKNEVEENVIINNDENQISPNSYSESKEYSQVTEPNPKEEEVKSYFDIENIVEKSCDSKNKIKDNLIKELESDEPFNENALLNGTSEPTSDCDVKKENIYYKDSEKHSTSEIKIQCNYENSLPDLTSESVDPESSDSNIYSHFNYSNNNINENKICVENVQLNMEKNHINNTANINNASTNSTFSMSCSETAPNRPTSRENLINDNVSLTDEIPKENENITKIKNRDDILENKLGTGCCVSDKESFLSDERLCVESTKENDGLIYDCNKESKNKNLESDDSMKTSFSEVNSLCLETVTDNVSPEERSSFIPNPLNIKQEVVQNTNLIFEDTIGITDSKTTNVIVSSTVPTDMICIEEKEELNFTKNNSISDNSSDKDIKTNNEMLFSNILNDAGSVFVINDEHSHKTSYKNDVGNSNSISDNIIQLLSYEEKKTLSLDAAIHTTDIKEIVDKQEASMLKNDGIKDHDLSNFKQKTNCEHKVIFSANAFSNEDLDEFDCKFVTANNDSHEIKDVNFENSYQTTFCEIKNELSDNFIHDTSIKQNDMFINFEFTNKVKHSSVKKLDITNRPLDKIRVHGKALFSPWIQKLILYDESSNENQHNTFKTDYISIDSSERERNENHAKNERDSIVSEKLNKFLSNNELDKVNILQSKSLKEFNDEDGIAHEYKSDGGIESAFLISSESEQNKMLSCSSPCMSIIKNPKLLRRTSKRSLSDTVIERYFGNNTEHLFISKKHKKYEDDVFQSHMIETNLCNIIQTQRRNSISETYDDGNVFILIDKDLILTEANEGQKICFTDVESVTDNAEYNSENIDDTDTLTENVAQDDKELWVDDVARIETIFSDEVAEDVEISTPISPKGYISNDYETLNNESFILCEEVIRNMENDVDIYESGLCKDDALSADSLCEIPKTFTFIESQNKKETFKEDKIEFKLNKEDNILNFLRTNDTLFSKDIFDTCSDSDNNRILDDKENLEIDNNLIQDSTKSQNSNISEKYDDFNCTVHPCNYSKYSSSPEVTSTTCEDKNAGILLKISNVKGSRTSQVDSETSSIKSKISYKLTEKKTYNHYNTNFNSSGTLLTKAAQKYIPPLKITMSDLKVKLPLPQNSLDKLKKMKKSKVEPKIDKKPFKPNSKSCPSENKKQKPKFEDVLLSIDEIHYNKHKVKNKKVRSEIPKVVIKKNETGAHYTSSRTNDQNRHDPDLTGRKWQPWVFLEKNSFIDKMVLKHKLKAIYCRRKHTFVLADKFRKYKSVYNAKFVISQPKTDDLSKGNLKYTIRLKHD